MNEIKESLPDFSGMLLSVICSSERGGQLIYSPWFERQAGRLFLVGTIPDDITPDEWMQGLTTAIAWDTVQDYVVFESIPQYKSRLRQRLDTEEMN